MAKLSKSEVKAAISKILARKEARPPIQPRRLPRRNFGKRLASLFAEAGIDVSKLEKIVSEEREGFARLQKKRELYYEKRNSALEKQYKATLENKKRALEAIAGQTIGVQFPYVRCFRHSAAPLIIGFSNLAQPLVEKS
jgi:hypothetical protein